MIPGFEEVDVEVWTGTPLRGDVLGVFVHHPDPDGRVNAETHAFAAGAEYVDYPNVPVLRLTEQGCVRFETNSMFITLGGMRILSPVLVKREEIEHLNFAIIFLVDEPFTSSLQGEKAWLAARVPLVISEKEDV